MNERIKEVIDYLKQKRMIYSQKDFVMEIKDNPSTVSEMISGRRPINDRFVERVNKKFPMINPVWLKDGVGEMLLPEEVGWVGQTTRERLLLEVEYLAKENKELKARIQEMSEFIGALKFQLSNGGHPA